MATIDYNKYQKLVLKYSYNGVTWTNVKPEQYKKGEVIEANSYDCGYIEPIYQWVAVDGEYQCINQSKYAVEKQQISYDGGSTWEDTGERNTGSLIEANSYDCDYGVTWQPVEYEYICDLTGGEPIDIDIDIETSRGITIQGISLDYIGSPGRSPVRCYYADSPETMAIIDRMLETVENDMGYFYNNTPNVLYWKDLGQIYFTDDNGFRTGYLYYVNTDTYEPFTLPVNKAYYCPTGFQYEVIGNQRWIGWCSCCDVRHYEHSSYLQLLNIDTRVFYKHEFKGTALESRIMMEYTMNHSSLFNYLD